MIQKSRSLIYPLFNFPIRLSKLNIETYMGHAGYEGDSIWGNYFYVEINALDIQADETLAQMLRKHQRYVTELHEETSVMFVFEFKPTEKLNIVIPFLQGKYSEICRDYVNKYFTKYVGNHELSVNWRILHKHVSLRHYWKNKIGTPIPEDSEVWPKPRMRDEIFGQVTLDQDELKEQEIMNNYSDIIINLEI